ncbi:hypothetical protein [Primorskyibacter sp. 2E233]|uniref:hypothetical protein n=1 Tax=Primorskyibacter sp. 2E233 TaxID=3413431 RepID=UPI003BF38279
MFSFLRRKLLLGVKSAAERGNPIAKSLVAREMRQVLDALPPQSPIVRGEYMTPDLSRPLPEEQRNEIVGEYEMTPLNPAKISPKALIGRRVETVMTNLGSYGMGGYGFFGLSLGEDWLVIPLVGAAEWIELDGRILQDPQAEGAGGKTAWIVGGDESALTDRLTGALIRSVDLRRHGLTMSFGNGAVLHIDENPKTRPVQAGSGQLRAFLEHDDLASAVFLSPSAEIYV